jgi:outer membrane protein TolC
MNCRRYLLLVLFLFPLTVCAQPVNAPASSSGKNAALPDPLTLKEALAYADAPHPDTDVARANLAEAEARERSAEADKHLDLYADVTPAYVDPADPALQPAQGDSAAQLVLRKPLYDFGRTRAREKSLAETVAGRRLSLIDAQQRRRLEIMQAFFNVLLADQRYMVDNEAMAHAYVVYDRIRQRHEMGHVSDVDMAAAQSHYQDLLIRRTQSQTRQRLTRQRLASLLNHPGQLPANLQAPTLDLDKRGIPDFDKLWSQVKQKNPSLLALDRNLAAAREQVKLARAGARPTLDAQLDAGTFQRALGNRNNWGASINLHIPIYQGGRTDSAVAQAQARLERVRARRDGALLSLRQTVADLLEQLDVLKVRHKAAQVRGDYRELYLDRARTLYELEKEVSLGDAMTRMTEAQWMSAQVDYDLAMTWARIDALTGSLGSAKPEEKKP